MADDPEVLRAIPEFAQLDTAELAIVGQLVHTRHLARDEVLFLEGEPGTALYYIRSGLMKIFKTSADGREQVLRLFHAGESFNDVPVFDGGPNPASAMALEPTDLYVIYRRDLLPLLASHPNIAIGVIQVLASRLRYMVGLVEDLSFRHVTARVAKILLTHSDELRPDAPHRLTQSEMAALAGTAREMVGRALKALEQEGAIAVNQGRIMIRDREKLAAML
jgi:CRP-like cAMP-binding protein